MTCVNITCQQQQLGSRTGEEHLRQTLEPTYNSICQASMVEQSHVREALRFIFQALWEELSGWLVIALFITGHEFNSWSSLNCHGMRPCYICHWPSLTFSGWTRTVGRLQSQSWGWLPAVRDLYVL